VSLRLRLLVAVGLISIAALVVADFATYSALRNSLYNQVDQELSHHVGVPVDPATGTLNCLSPRSSQASLSPFAGNSGPGPGDGDNRNGGPNASGINYSAFVDANGSVINGIQCSAYIGNNAYSPAIPAQITGYTTEPDGTQVAYFTAASRNAGGPSRSTATR
jgi:hypothetical protein